MLPRILYALQRKVLPDRFSQHTKKTLHVVGGTCTWMLWGQASVCKKTSSELPPFDVCHNAIQSLPGEATYRIDISV